MEYIISFSVQLDISQVRERASALNFRRLPKTFEEDPKMFRSYTNTCKLKGQVNHDISEVFDVFTSEDIENMVSYEFYEWCIFH